MDTCVKTPHNFILFDNVVLHILILFSILAGLFYFLIAKLETASINGEFIIIIDKIIDPDAIKEIIKNRANADELKNLLIKYLKLDKSNPLQLILLKDLTEFVNTTTDIDVDNLKVMLDKYINDYNVNAHSLRAETNKRIQEEIFIVIGFFILLAVVIYIMSRYSAKYCGFMKHLSIELLIIFACVGGIEYWFFTNVASKYVPVKPTVIMETFKQTMLNKLG